MTEKPSGWEDAVNSRVSARTLAFCTSWRGYGRGRRFFIDVVYHGTKRKPKRANQSVLFQCFFSHIFCDVPVLHARHNRYISSCLSGTQHIAFVANRPISDIRFCSNPAFVPVLLRKPNAGITKTIRLQ